MSDESSARLKNTKRNDPCPCGSGRKYKKCHQAEDEAQVHAAQKAAAELAAKEAAEAEGDAKKKASPAPVPERAAGRQNKPARGQGQPRAKNLPRRKAV